MRHGELSTPKHRRFRKLWRAHLAVPLAALVCAGCVYTIEEVFYAQNRATEALMWALSNPDLTDRDLAKLAKAEEKLIDACHPVNNLATTSLEGKKVTVTEGVEANSAKTSCAKQVKRVEKMLWEIDPEVAAAYWECRGCALDRKVANADDEEDG